MLYSLKRHLGLLVVMFAVLAIGIGLVSSGGSKAVASPHRTQSSSNHSNKHKHKPTPTPSKKPPSSSSKPTSTAPTTTSKPTTTPPKTTPPKTTAPPSTTPPKTTPPPSTTTKPTSTPPTTSSSPTASPSSSGGTSTRDYPLHTNINATWFWVGEEFQNTPDGSQICSAYDEQWEYNYFQNKSGGQLGPNASDCGGAYYGGCDALVKAAGDPCTDADSVGSLRTPANGYFPTTIPAVYQNPFYLDLPVDDYNPSDSTDTTAYSTRCSVIPWANDPGYIGNCTNENFSYMKNQWVQVSLGSNVCYGQVEDAGPADDGHGNSNYDDVNYVFSTTDARPYNTDYDDAGMDVSPALASCLGETNADFNDVITGVSWKFVTTPPTGPWTHIITTNQATGE